MFTCHGTLVRPAPHSHDSVTEAKVCYGLLPSYVTAPPTCPAPFKFGHRAAPEGPLSEPQYKYIGDLGGDKVYAKTLNYREASIYITRLKGGKTVTEPTPTLPPTPAIPPDPRLDMIKGMLDLVPDGYYAVHEYEGGHVEFIKISTPPPPTSHRRSKYHGTRKISTIHGSGLGKRLDVEAALWLDSGRWSIYRKTIVNWLMLVVADHHGAGLRYGELRRCCMACNADLTDGRSRWFRIGPECEKKSQYAWVIPSVIEERGDFTGER